MLADQFHVRDLVRLRDCSSCLRDHRSALASRGKIEVDLESHVVLWVRLVEVHVVEVLVVEVDEVEVLVVEVLVVVVLYRNLLEGVHIESSCLHLKGSLTADVL